MRLDRDPVVGLQLPYAAALATGRLMRVLLGQWDMLPRLRTVPDTVEEFSGYFVAWDPIALTGPDAGGRAAIAQARFDSGYRGEKAGDRIRTDDFHVGNVTLYH